MTATVWGEIVTTIPSRESVPYVIAVLRFRNDGPSPARVKRYRVVWSDGAITASPADLVLAPGTDREWRLRIDPSNGGLDLLTGGAALARLEILEVAATE